ncbi:MAG TPA: hypothetical protein VMT85_05140 [Thermoanaerobaculia bacterium]|nr:hypothetical protein [Thermoanaerobaculia bacterium]
MSRVAVARRRAHELTTEEALRARHESTNLETIASDHLPQTIGF